MIARSFLRKLQAMTSQSLQYSPSYIFCRKEVLPVQITHGISRSLEGGYTDWWDNSEQFENSDFIWGKVGGARGYGEGATHQNLTIFSVIFSLKNSPTCRNDL